MKELMELDPRVFPLEKTRTTVAQDVQFAPLLLIGDWEYVALRHISASGMEYSVLLHAEHVNFVFGEMLTDRFAKAHKGPFDVSDCGNSLFHPSSRVSERQATDRFAFPAPACTERCAGEGELVFALIHCDCILLDPAAGINRQVLPSFWPLNSQAGRGGLPHQGDLRPCQAVGLVDDVAEGALQVQGFGGEGAGGGVKS
jgi:hypothetical protein